MKKLILTIILISSLFAQSQSVVIKDYGNCLQYVGSFIGWSISENPIAKTNKGLIEINGYWAVIPKTDWLKNIKPKYKCKQGK